MKTSRSKVTSWFHCPRYRYLKYHYLGSGIQRATEHKAALMGKSIHVGNAQLMLGHSIAESIATAGEEFNKGFNWTQPNAEVFFKEQWHFIEGTIRAFNRVRVPKLLTLGKVIDVEREESYALSDDIEWAFRADAIIQTPDNMLIVVDYKPTAFGGYNFVRGWERNSQVLAYVAAAEAIYKLPVLGVQIEGYIKGNRRANKDLFGGQLKVQNSPLCYVWQNTVTGQISPEYQRAADWKRTPLWETSFTTKEYIEEFLTAEEVEHYFLAPVPPISPNSYRMERWKEQTVCNERRIEQAASLVEQVRVGGDEVLFLKTLNQHFPMNEDNCYKYGEDYPCEFDQICHNREVESDILASGMYEERKDHHETENEES